MEVFDKTGMEESKSNKHRKKVFRIVLKRLKKLLFIVILDLIALLRIYGAKFSDQDKNNLL